MRKKLNYVLLIDDDDVTNFLNRKVIEYAGIADHIEVKLNGREALEFISNKGDAKNSYLILLDINMPVMDGWEFIEAYQEKAIHAKGKANIVMLTTSFNPDDHKRAGDTPLIASYENKPLTVELLDGIMKRHYADH